MAGHAFSDEFVDLVTPHQSQLLGYLYAIVRNAQDAEDVLQQTYLELWRKFDQFDPQRSFFGWAREIARYKALTFLRQNRRYRLQFGSAVIELLADEMLAAPQKYEQESARLRSLRSCISQLKSRDQQLLRQCYRGGRTFRQVADMLGRSPQSVTNSLSRIRQALMECIQRNLAVEERA